LIGAISSNGGLLATVDRDPSEATRGDVVQLWNTSTGHKVGENFVGRDRTVDAMTFSPKGTVLAVGGSDGAVRLWDVATGDPIGQPLTGVTGGVNTVAFNADGTLLAAGGSGGTIMLWDTATGLPLGGPLTGHTHPISALAFSPRGGLLVSVDFNSTLLTWRWNVQEACGIAARYVTREQVESYVPSDWHLHCDYPE